MYRWENDYYNPTFAITTTEAYVEDYVEEQAIEYNTLRSEEDRLLHDSYRNAQSIDRGYKPSIDIHHHQTNRGCA